MKRMFLILFMIFISATITYAEFHQMTTIPQYQCLSIDKKITSGIYPGSILKELDTGRVFVFNGTTWIMDAVGMTYSVQTLRRPSTTTARSVVGFSEATYTFTVSGVTGSIVCNMEGKLLGSGWVGLIPTDTTISSNESYGFCYKNCASLDSVRFNFKSESDTTSVIAVALKVGR